MQNDDNLPELSQVQQEHKPIPCFKVAGIPIRCLCSDCEPRKIIFPVWPENLQEISCSAGVGWKKSPLDQVNDSNVSEQLRQLREDYED